MEQTAGPPPPPPAGPLTNPSPAHPAAGLPSPPESATSEPSSSSRTKQTGPYLEDLSRSILEVNLNERQPDHPLVLKHMATAFRSKHDVLRPTDSRADHQGNLQAHLADSPRLHVEIRNASSDVDDGRGRATVYLWYTLSGLGHAGFEREAVAVLSWERRKGLWQVVKHTGMRGPCLSVADGHSVQDG